MCDDGKPHKTVPGPPVVYPDGSKSPSVVCTKCGRSWS